MQLERVLRRNNVEEQRKGEISRKRKRYKKIGRDGARGRGRKKIQKERHDEKDANSRPGKIKMSRVYPGTNTPR